MLRFAVQNVVHLQWSELRIRSVVVAVVERFFILLLRGVVLRLRMIWVGMNFSWFLVLVDH